ncbi:MAG: DUF4160 domain-containing protein [Deltaproteobacteria bacterium]|nr:DUF4160 domain-containing protein [Deltaproteobacteria bacterium]
MTTIHRFRNNKYRLQIRERDHNPPHVHLVGGAYDVVIDLESLASDGKWPRGLRDEVLAWIQQNHKELLEEWHK